MPTVLVVDDDTDGRNVVSQFLSKSGYTVRAAPNGRMALIELAAEVPDVVILDMMMPEMDGVEFLRIIRSYLRWSTVPVIVLTAYPEGTHIDVAMQLGAKSIFVKGNYQFAELLACIQRLLHNGTNGTNGTNRCATG